MWYINDPPCATSLVESSQKGDFIILLFCSVQCSGSVYRIVQCLTQPNPNPNVCKIKTNE